MNFSVLIFGAVHFLFHMSLVDARNCWMSVEGEKKSYLCPKNQYCCSFGCCISPTIQFYQLWYYWLMVIFMFLLCSGGGWWYRYWLHDRYPTEFSNTLHSHQPPRPCPRPYRQARISYHPTRETIILHHVWKGPGHSQMTALRTSPPPPYQPNGAVAASTIALPSTSPYYQIYGPPPSYDSVVTGTPSDDIAGTSGFHFSGMLSSRDVAGPSSTPIGTLANFAVGKSSSNSGATPECGTEPINFESTSGYRLSRTERNEPSNPVGEQSTSRISANLNGSCSSLTSSCSSMTNSLSDTASVTVCSKPVSVRSEPNLLLLRELASSLDNSHLTYVASPKAASCSKSQNEALSTSSENAKKS